MSHPYKAYQVGSIIDGGTSISSSASNFAVNLSNGVDGFIKLGPEQNAIRHVLWQAMLTNKFGEHQAKRIGNAHEDNPRADITQTIYSMEKDADQAVDLLNNEIGRNIGENTDDYLSLPSVVLETYYKEGLWVVSQNEDGTFSIGREKISKEQYEQGLSIINQKNQYGLNK